MKRATTVFGRSLTKGCKRPDARARSSSLVDLNVQTQYRLPLTILPLGPLPIQLNDIQSSTYSPFEPFHDTTRLGNGIGLCHVNIPSQNIKTFEWRGPKPKPALSHRNLSSEMLQSTLNTETRPTKPDKPKWEEEQYPDIGKSTYFQRQS
jgi:hypothetical protein